MNVVDAGEEITIRNVAVLWEQVKKAVPVELDCRHLVKVDGAGYQLLLYVKTLESKEPERYHMVHFPVSITAQLEQWHN